MSAEQHGDPRPDPGAPDGTGRATPDRAQDRRGLRSVDWREVGRRALVWLVVAVVAVLVALGLAAFVPRWWAQQVGRLVDGTFSLGVWWGVAIGLVFTALPMAVAWPALRPGHTWRTRGALVVAALVLALPNLLTLSVVLGTNAAAHAGQRIMDVDAPAFRGATAWGAAIGALLTVAVLVLWASYRRRGRELRKVRGED
ncbi:hypothetical protein [Isoptericola variabilis]|uniref:Permease n=1 Tax=Isoptericola variabilis (strain 225) TaxID=743718 RepID=F6FTA6_ISOV2|nr:hypothetical protein [Isoptericola variabilis]AEG45270.1 hypothetical protein Isova_2566 [Isoptericola variabilis 225]TWH30973.1 hypothetical protein L600_002800000380 [Isoptericola variabilis J7]